ncbi:unnamed protein product [Brassica oleracea var. botrytis]
MKNKTKLWKHRSLLVKTHVTERQLEIDVIFGVAFVKVARAILENPTDKTKVHLIQNLLCFEPGLATKSKCLGVYLI